MRSGLLLAFVLAGCRREPMPPPTLEIAEPAGGAEKITCRVGPKQTTVSLDERGLRLRFVTARGNTVSMFGQDVVVGDPAAEITLANAVAGFADGPAGRDWIDTEAKVASPDGQKVIVKVSFHIDGAMNTRLEAARGKPMLFPAEAAGTTNKKLAWVRLHGEGPAEIVGEGRWRDIDLVAFEWATDILHDCGSKPGDWGPIGILHTETRSHVELYDRRTGKRVDETTIEGHPECDAGSASNGPAIRAWVSSKLAGK